MFADAETVSPFTGLVRTLSFGSRQKRQVDLAHLPAWKTFIVSEGAAQANEALQRLIRDGRAKLRWWPDASAESAFADYALDTNAHRKLDRKREGPAMPFYAVSLKLLKLN